MIILFSVDIANINVIIQRNRYRIAPANIIVISARYLPKNNCLFVTGKE